MRMTWSLWTRSSVGNRAWRTGGRLLVLFVLLAVGERAAAQSSLDAGWEKLRRGEYAEAIARLQMALDQQPARAAEGLITAYAETGRYEDAERTAREVLARADRALTTGEIARLEMLLGEIHLMTGRYEDAQRAFDRALAHEGWPGRLRAGVQKGWVLWQMGRVEEAREWLRRLTAQALAQGLQSAEDLTWAARAFAYLDRPHEANELYAEAIERDPAFREAYLQAGDLFVERYNYAEAASFFRDALRINPHCARAHLGLARSTRINGGSEAFAHVQRALAVNPRLVEAHDLMAALLLEVGDIETAERHLGEALRVNPHSLSTRALRAVAFYLEDRAAELAEEIQRVLRSNPRYGELYATLADFAVLNRRYPEAVEFARRAVELSPWLWRAWATLGLNLLRLGRDAEGREVLERAFAGDPFNVWVKNTLDLLDSMRAYRETITEHFLIRMAPSEHPVVAPLVADLLERAYGRLSERYQFRPDGPIIVELFPNHEDFAVKTVGLPGLGALGACFGRVIVMDSPSARPQGSFNWASTAWHEFVHVITLQATAYRIPRWFSEGISVYEERRARPGWGHQWTLEFAHAFAEGQFVPLRHLEAAFLRPSSPQALSLAYFQASLVVEFIVERFGFERLRHMLALYRQGERTEGVFQKALGMSVEELDRLFREHVAREIGPYLSRLDLHLLRRPQVSEEEARAALARHPENFAAHLRLGRILRARGDLEAAIVHLREAIRLFPFYTGPENAYEALAAIFEARGDEAEALSVLQQWATREEANEEVLRRVLRLALKLGKKDIAENALEAILAISPLDRDVQAQAGEFYLEQNQPERAVRAFSAVLHLNPPDRAEAHYQLARALLAKGARAEARREILRALEIAPGFEKAQALLLKLVEH
ncbi:MAG: tetratricopeptide repeat protein [Blastocatellia bacterium]|nr:tetratricopeptide repeat protein [Blastocatellia bacterium]MCS7157146.1 tetratricopeptide repeat protein [Blastocatellia bacterium]MCX7752391.1 tetratricopeptide repeat protein [Blastocatellia bacterium]MDW8167274.1 tetratricopeptide repeat protein [Acidobacteriota bacterium]